MPSDLLPPRVVTTGLSADGKAIVAIDALKIPFHPFGPEATGFTILHSTESSPACNTAALPEATASIPRPPPSGTVFCTSDFPPGSSSPMHRTVTLDYCVVLKGEIVLQLDGGEEVILKEGEMATQRGALHAWHNRTDRWTRLLFVMLDAEKVVTERGTVLEESFPS